MTVRRILLVGGGHGHLEVLRRFAQQPDPGIELTLASPNALCPYSSMMPGFIAGHYGVAESHVDLPALATWARARYVCDRAVELDLYTRIVRLGEGGVEPFDLMSLDIGSSPDLSVPGVREHALPLCPADRFLAGWTKLEADAAAGTVRTVAVVGDGANVPSPTGSNWNQRPRDVSNICRWTGRQQERPLNFQIVSIDSPEESFSDAPLEAGGWGATIVRLR